MPFCPKCKYEFVEGIKQCADCLVDLVENLPDDDVPKENFRWVPMPSLPGPVYAEMVKEALEKNGIPCLIRKDFLASAYGSQGTTSPGSGNFILVPEDRLAESEEILNQMLDHD